MAKILALNCPGSMTVKSVENDNVELTADFGSSGTVTAVVDWKDLRQALWSRNKIYDFVGSGLLHVVRVTRNHLFGKATAYYRLTTMNMYFTPTKGDSDLIMIITWADLKKALDETKPA
jgi:hypothetical protein